MISRDGEGGGAVPVGRVIVALPLCPALVYLLTSVTVVNATAGFSLLKRIPLELSRATSEFPAHLLHAPTVVDLDSRSGDVEVSR